ncbi:MAG: class I SAM-dependent methyltransferase [Phycisphaerae bacterium]|jgi:SAM-dependent methyltransferase
MSPALDYAQVAELYDSYAVFTDDVPFFVNESRNAAGRVLELMSGTGRVSIPLIEAGIDLTCTDSSPDMLTVLRRKLVQRGLQTTVLERDATALGFDEDFALAILPFHSFSELLTRDEQMAALRSVRDAIKPGGAFICTLHNPTVRLKTIGEGMVTYGRHPSPSGDGELVLKADLTHDPATGLVRGTQIMEECEKRHPPRVLVSLPVRFALIEQDNFEKMAEESGFTPENLYGDYQNGSFDPTASANMIWVLRRPA